MKKAVKLIIKEVGINGLIAIKADYNNSCCLNFYHYIRRYNTEFDIHSLIYCHLTMVKDYAQY